MSASVEIILPGDCDRIRFALHDGAARTKEIVDRSRLPSERAYAALKKLLAAKEVDLLRGHVHEDGRSSDNPFCQCVAGFALPTVVEWRLKERR